MASSANGLAGYRFYDSAMAMTPLELQELYSFTTWGRSRSVDAIARMLAHTDLCFSVRFENSLVAFCRILTDFTFRGSLWDVMVHPDHQGKGLGTELIRYALDHPAVAPVPLIVTYTTELQDFLAPMGFRPQEGLMMLLRRPLEYS